MVAWNHKQNTHFQSLQTSARCEIEKFKYKLNEFCGWLSTALERWELYFSFSYDGFAANFISRDEKVKNLVNADKYVISDKLISVAICKKRCKELKYSKFCCGFCLLFNKDDKQTQWCGLNQPETTGSYKLVK